MPSVSVLLPNYNNAPFLKEAIDSILNQTFRDFELLIVDDGSTDDSIAIISSYTDKRIRLIRKTSNSGIVDTMNVGLDAIDAIYMARMDGDDISAPNRLEKLFSFMEQHTSTGLCSSALKVFGNVKEEVWPIDTDPDILKAGLIRGVTTPHAPSMFRMKVLNESGLRYRNNVPHMEDFDLFFRLKAHTDFCNLPDVLYHYRILDHNVTARNRSSMWERYSLIYREVLSELGIEPTPEYLEMHRELFHQVEPAYPADSLYRYKELLIRQNELAAIYPPEAFRRFLETWWNSLFCRLIDKAPANYSLLKKTGVRPSMRQKYYYFRNRSTRSFER